MNGSTRTIVILAGVWISFSIAMGAIIKGPTHKRVETEKVRAMNYHDEYQHAQQLEPETIDNPLDELLYKVHQTDAEDDSAANVLGEINAVQLIHAKINVKLDDICPDPERVDVHTSIDSIAFNPKI